MLLYRLGRFLQVVGMILLPVAIAGNASDRREVPPVADFPGALFGSEAYSRSGSIHGCFSR